MSSPASVISTSLQHKAGELAPVLDWIDGRFGPILRVMGFRPPSPEPEWWTYLCDVARPIGRHFSVHHNNAQGTSIDEAEALKRALGEAIERYVIVNAFDSARSTLLTAEQNPLLATLPRCLADENCDHGFKQFPADTPLTHWQVQNLADGSIAHLPAGHVHTTFKPPADEPYVVQPTSSGSAFHTTLPRAILSAICEVAERDAAMSFWFNSRCAARLHFQNADVPAPLRERFNRIEQAGLQVLLFDISTEFPLPSVICMVKGETYPYQTFGSACDPDPARACIRAVDEAIATRFKQLNSSHRTAVPTRESFEWVQDFDDHAEIYAGWKDCPALEFFATNPTQMSFAELHSGFCPADLASMQQLQTFAQHLASMGLNVFWCDITTDDTRQFGCCVRVVIPEMVPLSIDHNIRWLGTPRLSRGTAAAKTSATQFNPYPHPIA